jgi:hypothetical protein
MGGFVIVLFGAGFIVFLLWGFIEVWKTPGLGRAGFFKKIGKMV